MKRMDSDLSSSEVEEPVLSEAEGNDIKDIFLVLGQPHYIFLIRVGMNHMVHTTGAEL